MGRKKKKAAEKRTNTLHIKLTEAERVLIDKAASADEMETSTFVRRTILDLIRKRKLG